MQLALSPIIDSLGTTYCHEKLAVILLLSKQSHIVRHDCSVFQSVIVLVPTTWLRFLTCNLAACRRETTSHVAQTSPASCPLYAGLVSDALQRIQKAQTGSVFLLRIGNKLCSYRRCGRERTSDCQEAGSSPTCGSEL